ncbi:MAG: hypothetical protein JSV88_13890, partial [Candidatus Aminicenantes bacterium]
MQRRNCFRRVNIAALGFFLVFLFIFNNSSVLSASTDNSNGKTGKRGRHFIVLLDSKVAVEKIFKKSSQSKSGDFFGLLKDALEKNPYNSKPGEKDNDNDLDALDYKTYKEGRDIVSIVLHHFSSKGYKNPPYFYTFTDIILIERFLEAKSALIDSLKRKFRYYKTFIDPMSPEKIANAEEIVLPYLCARHNGYKKDSSYMKAFREFEKYTIEDIVIISIYEKTRENKTSVPKKEWEEFNNHFEYKHIKTNQPDDDKNIIVDYISVKPRHKEDFPILKVDKEREYQLERFAKRSPVLHYWRGESGLAGLPEGYRLQGYRLQWSGGPAPGDIHWKDIKDIIDEKASLYLAENDSQVYIQSAYIKENESNKARESDNEGNAKIYYRIVINDYNPGGDLKYPFKYSPAMEIKSITYQLQEQEKYAPGFPWIRSVGYVNEEDLEVILVNRKNLPGLSAAEAVEIFKRQALIKLSAVYAGIIVVLFVFYL